MPSCSIGMLMPSIGVTDRAAGAELAFLGAAFFVLFLAVEVAFFFGAALLAAGFFLGGGFAGIGMVMPGMCIWAAAGTASGKSASALAAMSNLDFTVFLRRRRRRAERAASPFRSYCW